MKASWKAWSENESLWLENSEGKQQLSLGAE